jgi:uncharacterized protein with von Willebrand factor type A (vWA) domain
MVTLLTRKFGRGLDFKPSKQVNARGGVLVIQTFFSSSESEQIQIMGRTARQGEDGSYRLMLCATHLQEKFGFKYKTSMPNAELEGALKAVRTAKVQAKFEFRVKNKMQADRADKKSWELVQALHGQQQGNGLGLLNSLAGVGSTTFVLMLDISGSMDTHCGSLREAFGAFCHALAMGGHGEDTLITLITFNQTAKIEFSNLPLPKVQGLDVSCSGGTKFQAAFALCHTQIATAPPLQRFSVLFMTDGEDSTFSVDDVLHPMLDEVGGRIEEYHSIAFGNGGGGTKLQAVIDAFRLRGVRARAVSPRDKKELVEAFASAAVDTALRLKPPRLTTMP